MSSAKDLPSGLLLSPPKKLWGALSDKVIFRQVGARPPNS
jgi:hypothetical protein